MLLESTDKMERWFVVCCKPRQEQIAQENLLRQDFRVYLPLIKVQKRSKGKWEGKIEVLFPRYVFIRVNPQRKSISSVRSTRGVVGLVKFGEKLAVIPDEVMNVLQHRVMSESGLRQDEPLFSEGETIRLAGGAFDSMEGVFVQADGNRRVIILLDLLGKLNKVSVSLDWVSKV